MRSFEQLRQWCLDTLKKLRSNPPHSPKLKHGQSGERNSRTTKAPSYRNKVAPTWFGVAQISRQKSERWFTLSFPTFLKVITFLKAQLHRIKTASLRGILKRLPLYLHRIQRIRQNPRNRSRDALNIPAVANVIVFPLPPTHPCFSVLPL